jgi:protein-disulfide isomerase
VRTALPLAVVALLAGGCGGSGNGNEPSGQPPARVVAESSRLFAGVPQRATRLGDAHAPATLIEFADLQCPQCQDYDRKVLPVLVERYVRPGKLSLELRELALIGPESLKGAAWALAAMRQDRLYQFSDLFYRNQGAVNSGYVTDEFLSEIASAAGLDVARARRYASSKAVQRRLTRTTDQARGSGVTATPRFFIGRRGGSLGELPVKSQTPDSFTRPLDSLLAR